jgi:hypothetical protein
VISNTLPHDAITKLLAVQNVPIDKDPLARQKTLEKVTAEIKQKYPQFFKQEEI